MSEKVISVVVVDDDPSVFSSLVTFLDDEGFDVNYAQNGEDGLRIINDKQPDVGIIDIRMPGIDGNVLIEKASARYPSMKFIILTGSSDYVLTDVMRACGLKNENVFLKPVFNMTVLSDFVRTISD